MTQTKEHDDTLREIIEQARAQQPLNSALDYACKFTTCIQELLVYVSATCPSSLNVNEKLVAITPINKNKKVRLEEPEKSTSNTPTQADSQNSKITNQPLLTSTGVKNSTSGSGSQPLGNTKKIGSREQPVATRRIKWIPTRQTFTIDGNKCPLTRITSTTVVPPKKPFPAKVVQIVLWYLDSDCSKHMTGQRSQLINFVSKFIGTVRIRIDHVAGIMGYEDYQIGNATISRVYYVEGLGHNLFSVGQLCDSDLEVAFRKHTCFVRDLEGVDLLKGSRGTNLYTLSVEEMMQSSPNCLLFKASKTKSWLWNRRLSHLNFGTINELAKQGLVRGLPKLKYQKDHL
ncbi:retrovirus-related pol polyprotein from transposon TNT 1-94 [Tanacetum coccineum]